jgi:DNA-binding transcriptional MocR family regulator
MWHSFARATLATIGILMPDLQTILGGRFLDGPGPLYRRLAQAIADAAERGDLEPGAPLPAERALADVLGVSRTTAVAAYAELQDRGVIERRRGSGTRLAPGAGGAPPHVPLGRIGRNAVVRSLIEGAGDALDLTAAALPINPVMDVELLRGAATELAEPRQGLGYHPLGLPALRRALAAHLSGWGLPTRPEQVLVTAGAQQATALVAALHLRAGDAAVVEDATYVGSLDAVAATGARVAGTPIDDAGVLPDELEATVRRERARLVYLVATHNNPTGTTLPPLRRRAVARMARRLGVVVVEDCTHADLWLTAPPPPPIAAIDADAPVITVGSLSKLLWGGLRLGFVRASEDVVGRLGRLKTASDHGTSVPSQAIAAAALARAEEARVHRLAEVTDGLARLEGLLARHLPEWSYRRPDGGLSLWPRLPHGDADVLAEVALRHGVAIVPGPTCSPDGGLRDRVRLPLVRDPETMQQAIERLAVAWRTLERPRRLDAARVVV